MAYVLVAGGVLACSHQGRARLAASDSRLTVDGHAVVVSGQEAGISFATGAPGVDAPCPITAPNGAPSPCTATLAATGGVSAKITVGGTGALLDSATGSATNAQDAGATWSVSDPGQRKLSADG
jgi:hypothetical protein